MKKQLDKLDLKSDLRRADEYIAELELSRDLSQTIVHIDCDAFYAAVEELDRPDLKDVPFAVGKGVLTTCNYHARKFGCRSGMAGFVAMKLCPSLICLPMNFDKYTAKAKEVRAVLAEYDARFESASIDEAYLNITQYCVANNLDPEDAISQLRKEVHEKCLITISAGIAANAKIAKIASNRNKPNGQFRVASDRAVIVSFMASLPTRKVNGVGRVFERELDAIGIKTCGDIYEHRAYLARLFGEKAFQFLMQTYLGLGRTDVQPAEEYERKSVGTESTFRDMSSKTELRDKLRHTAEELEKDMARTQFKGRTLVLKIKLHTFEVFTRQVAPPKAVSSADDLYNYSLPMLAKLEKEMPGMKLRLMGLRCTHLVSTKKPEGTDFFASRPPRPTKLRRQPSAASLENNQNSDEWEVWPDSEFEEAARQERVEEMNELNRLGQDAIDLAQSQAAVADFHEPFGRYKHGNLPNPAPLPSQVQRQPSEELWNCPICSKPQVADDREFNDHIDFCLSRQSIKEAVKVAQPSIKHQQEVELPKRPGSSTAKRKASTNENGQADRRQKRLFFT